MSKYEMIIYWSEEDQSFVVEVPELAGCMADGSTYGEAVANAEKTIEEWIKTAGELGREIPVPHGRLGYGLSMQDVMAIRVEITEDTVWVDLADGRKLGVPLAYFPQTRPVGAAFLTCRTKTVARASRPFKQGPNLP